MTYKIYTTDGFVIKTRPSKDADVSLLLFTEDLGLLNATAKSVRLEKSKLRYALQSLSYSSFSFVKGREVWRVTSAKKHISLYDSRLPVEIRAMFARILMFIERFCPREQEEREIFALLKQISGFVFKELNVKVLLKSPNTMIDPELLLKYVESVEIFFIVRSLYAFGYVKKDEIVACADEQISISLLESLSDKMVSSHIRKIIEKGITESHL